MQSVKRLYFHTKRYSGEIIYSSIILAVLMLLIAVAFPNDNAAIAGYMDILTEAGMDALFSSSNLELPGWLFWVSLMGSTYSYFVSAIASIKIGSKLFPSDEDSALEMIVSSPKSSRSYFIENIFSSIIAVIFIFLPSFIILSLYSISQNTADSIVRLAVMFLFNIVICLFFISLTSAVSVISFSKGTGTKVGYFYLIYAFLVELSAGSVDGYSEYANLSVNSYLLPSSGLLNGEHRWEEAGIILFISIILISISYIVVKRPDYIERVSISKKTSLGLLPKFSSKGNLASKYPLLFDQFRNDRSYFFIWMGIVNFIFIYIVTLYGAVLADDPTVLTTLMASFDTPMMTAFTNGYAIEASFIGFLSLEIFGLTWLYYGVFVLIPAINIANRDQHRDEQDLIWSNSITPIQVILKRTLAIIIFFTVFYWSSSIVLISISSVFNLEISIPVIFLTYFIGYIYFIGLTLLVIGISMYFPVNKGKKYSLWFYLISIIIQITAYIEPSIKNIRYISIVNYYDPVGLTLEKVDVNNQMIISGVILILSLIIYSITLNYKFKKVNLIS